MSLAQNTRNLRKMLKKKLLKPKYQGHRRKTDKIWFE